MDECGCKIEAEQATNQEEIYKVIKDATIIIATGKAGVELISKETLMKLKGKKIIADINAIPPLGVSELKPKHDLREVAPDVYGIGALAVGELKYNLEQGILIDAKNSAKGLFDYNYAFERARKLLEKEKNKRSLTFAKEIKSPSLTINSKGMF